MPFALMLLNSLGASPLTPRRVRAGLMRAANIRSSSRAVNAGCFFGGSDIAIGKGTFINVNCLFDNSAPIAIGEHCHLGHGVSLITSDHTIGPPARRAGPGTGAPISIGDGSWIGAGTTILPGTTIEPGCVIAAGAVVRGRCEANGLYAGVPAARRRELPTA